MRIYSRNYSFNELIRTPLHEQGIYYRLNGRALFGGTNLNNIPYTISSHNSSAIWEFYNEGNKLDGKWV